MADSNDETADKFDLLKALGAADKLVSQGAEGRVFEGKFLQKNAIIKQRFKKSYRHPILDRKITKQRLTQEARALVKARKLGVRSPVLLHVDVERATLYMEKVEGEQVKNLLLNHKLDQAGMTRVLSSIGEVVAALHDGGLIHGDLTTSNMILTPQDNLVLIDYGLSSNSSMAEDKGVDLYVLERAFTSAHSDLGDVFQTVMDSYRKHTKNWSSVYNKFAEVRMRGRKRTMVG